MKHYDILKMQELLQDFHNLTGIKICIYDNAENELCFYPEKLTAFCKLLRDNPQLDEECAACDKNAFYQCKKTHRQHRYICHAGLLECVSPILYKDDIIGYIVIGQIRTNRSRFAPEAFPDLSQESKTELALAYDKLPLIEFDKIKSAIRILDACASYEYLKGLIAVADREIDKKIDSYITAHLHGDLSVQILCSEFHLSRNELYSVFREYFHDSPAEYIKKRRLNKACAYLAETEFPINIIAQKCGIPDYNYFTKIFKRSFGISPRDYRKNALTNL